MLSWRTFLVHIIESDTCGDSRIGKELHLTSPHVSSAGGEAASLHAHLGTEFYRRGLHDRAAQEFRKALADDPGSADLHNDLAIALSAQGLYEEAVASLRRALALDPAHTEARRNLALALRATGQDQPPHVPFAH